jgi:predicted RNA methylase
MELDGVLYVGRTPAAYFREVPSITDDLARDLQRCLWNHAIAPILVLASEKKVRVYSGRTRPARPDEAPDGDSRPVRILDITGECLEARQLLEAIETGHFLSEFSESFGRDHTVDRYLLQNLEDLRDQLSKGAHHLPEEMVHNLLMRLLFTCYLVEREIILGKHFPDPHLSRLSREGGLGGLLKDLTPAQARETLYSLFGKLKAKFNGTLFDSDLAGEKQRLRDRDVGVIQAFLQGHEVGTEQLTLGFWAYDFSIIPVETISGIYEHFVKAKGEESQREAGAYYTPPHLAELVIDAALQGRRESLLDMTVLDPSCGSGIFLVGIFNRMAQEWRSQNPTSRNGTRARELLKLLENRVFGVDTLATACRTACFSLYLALLDQLDPPDIHALEGQGQRLPRLFLPSGTKQPSGLPRPIVCGSFFDPELPLARKTFDLVIGNPPWVSRGKATDEFFLKWMSVDRDVRAPQKQMANGFMWKVPDHLEERGTACLLLPSGVILNRTDKFQQAWFGAHAVERIVNLSDLSFILFPGAIRPAVIVRFRKATPADAQFLIEYENPKADRTTLLGGPISIYAEDSAGVRLSDVVASAKAEESSVLWKTHFWGTPRDLRFLGRLRDLPRLEQIVGTARKPKRLICGQGIQPFNPKKGADVEKLKQERRPGPGWWDEKRLFLDAKAKNLELIVLATDCKPIGNKFPLVHRSRDASLFEPPLVLVSQGSSKVAFADFPLVFQHALQSIKGGERDAQLLKFLAAVLNSNLATYFFFHTAANWGTERDKVHLFEMLRLPFLLPEDCPDPNRAKEIVAKVAAKLDRLKQQISGGALGRSERIEQAKAEIEPLVREYYDVDEYEAMLLQDTIAVSERSSTPASPSTEIPALRKPSSEEQAAYVSTLCGMLNVWASRAGFCVSGKVLSASFSGMALVTLSKGNSAQEFSSREAPDKLKDAVRKISAALPKQEGQFLRQRGLRVFDGRHIHILKPLALRFWTRTAALNDADEIAAAILERRRGD